MTATTTLPAAPPLVRKYYTADEVNFTPGERSFVAWASCEVVDHEGDVVVAAGVDLAVYMKNPVLMAIHDMGRWPLGKAEWLKAKNAPAWRGLYGKFDVDGTADTEVVWLKIQGRTVRALSIQFRAPDGMRPAEWGPPTAEELRRCPHWKGARRVIRRCVLLEISVCPVGMCPEALIEAVSKGLREPVFHEAPAMPDPETETAPADTPAVPPAPAPEAPPEPDPEPAAVPAGAKALRDDDGDAGDEPDDDADDGPVRKGQCVRCVKGAYRGCVGRVKSLHRGGPVPDVDEDVMGTRDDPAARVQTHKPFGGGHKEMAHHFGVKVKYLERVDDLKPPGRAKAAAAGNAPGAAAPEARAFGVSAEDFAPAPDFAAERRELLARTLADPAYLARLARRVVDEMQGAV